MAPALAGPALIGPHLDRDRAKLGYKKQQGRLRKRCCLGTLQECAFVAVVPMVPCRESEATAAHQPIVISLCLSKQNDSPVLAHARRRLN